MTGGPQLSEAQIAAQLLVDRAEQVYMLIAFYLEAIIYGVYFILFVGAMHIMIRDRSQGKRVSKIFFFSMIFMFTLATVYTGVNAYRFTRAYAQNFGSDMPVYYFRRFGEWDNISYVVIVIVLVLHADALVIYRCWVIWERNFYVILIPSLLLLYSFVINSITLTWFINHSTMDIGFVMKFFGMIYPVNLAQNCLTTGLIAFKIWKQHHSSRKAGLQQSSGLHLITVARIIIESASVYTLQQLLMLIFNLMKHRAEVIFHATMVPSIGIVFVLIAIRTHIARAAGGYSQGRNTLLIPSYLRNDSPAAYDGNSGSIGILTMLSEPDLERGSIDSMAKTSRSSTSSHISDDEKASFASRHSPPSPPPVYSI